jgi:hypothetical protein
MPEGFNITSITYQDSDDTLLIFGDTTIIDEKTGEETYTTDLIKINTDGSLDDKFKGEISKF